jgi:large subunit ribosomal protein L30
MAATKKKESAGGGFIKITLKKGLVGKLGTHRKVVDALGLGKFGSSVVHSDSPTIRGMVRKIIHLVEVEQAEAGAKSTSKNVAKEEAK